MNWDTIEGNWKQAMGKAKALPARRRTQQWQNRRHRARRSRPPNRYSRPPASGIPQFQSMPGCTPIQPVSWPISYARSKLISTR